MRDIRRAAVLGSGVMGGAIAGVLANCGIPCLMLDILPPDLSDSNKQRRSKRNALALASKAALLKTKPSPIFNRGVLDLIEVGNFEDDFQRIADCDWICEVVKEDLAVKQAVFEQVARYRSRGSIVSTNTSGIPVQSMVDTMDEEMRSHFLGTHFFNPPRYLKLLEIVPAPDTSPEVLDAFAHFGENVLGKGVVYAKDTPNFVANRILTFTVQYVMHEMLKDGLTFEEVDALTGPVIGHASSATFRTADLVGLDTLLHVINNVYNGCPADEKRDLLVPPEFVKRMIQNKYYGEKTGSGFYKKTNQRDENGKSVIYSLDPNSLDYKQQVKPNFECLAAAKKLHSLREQIVLMHKSQDKGAQFVWKVFANSAIYAANRIPEIADDIVNIDNALKWGFGWEMGLFEVWDLLGFDYVCDRMEAEGLKLPPIARQMKKAAVSSFYARSLAGQTYYDLLSKSYKPVPQNPNVIRLDTLKQSGRTIKENTDATLVDLGDGILCAEFHCKMNALSHEVVAVVTEGINLINDGKYQGMVLGNHEPHFSSGANLMLVLAEIRQNNWEGLRRLAQGFQATNMSLRFCRGPIVAAPHHYTLGGGIEMSQHCSRAVISAETYGGLVEAGVGLVPSGGGTKEMLRRSLAYVPECIADINPFPYLRRAFESVAMAKVSTSGPELIDLGYFNDCDVVCINGDQQVKKAKDVCLGLVVSGYKAPKPAVMTALGEPARAVFRTALYNLNYAGFASEHDVAVAMHLANVLTGGNRLPGTKMTEQDVLDLECEAFLSLCGMEKTQERIQHMLITGKPLRN